MNFFASIFVNGFIKPTVEKSKSIHINTLLKEILFRVTLLFSVFIFTGFNPNLQATDLQSFTTELIDQRENQPGFDLNYTAYKKYEIRLQFLDFIGFEFSDTYFLKNRYVAELQSLAHGNKVECCNNSSIKVPYSIPVSSSDDEFSLLSLS